MSRKRARRLRLASLAMDFGHWLPAPARRHPDPVAVETPPERDHVALVMHTSGTTGLPKPVALTFGNIRLNARGLAQAMGLGGDERWLCPLPLAHVGGLMVVLRSALMATTAVLAPPPFDEHAIAERLRDGAITVASLVPTQLQRL